MGFFVLGAHVNSSEYVFNKVLGEVNKISSKFFLASLSEPAQVGSSLNNVTENIIPALSSEDNNDIAEDNSNNYDDTLVAIPSKESIQDQLDDIQEKLDVISQQVQDLIAEQNSSNQLTDDKNVQNKVDDKNDEQNKDKKDKDNQDLNNKENNLVSYPKILISEVQVAGISDDKQEFIELYNPNNTDVDLTGWYLQRKDSKIPRGIL